MTWVGMSLFHSSILPFATQVEIYLKRCRPRSLYPERGDSIGIELEGRRQTYFQAKKA